MNNQNSQNNKDVKNNKNNKNDKNDKNNKNNITPRFPQSHMPQRSQQSRYPRSQPLQQRPAQRMLSNSNTNSAKDANMINPPVDEFQKERTQIFDSMSNEKGINRSNLADYSDYSDSSGYSKPASSSNPNNSRGKDDGSYNYTGRNIHSSRQKFVDVSPNSGNMGNKKKSGGYNDDGIAVSDNSKEKNKISRFEAKAQAKSGGFIMSGILKAILYIAGVVLVSVILAYNIISIANDIFAFVKEPLSADVTIPENATVEDISRILYENNLIKYPDIFNFYINYKKKDSEWEFVAGTYPISSTVNYDDMIAEFRKKAEKLQTIRITVPEGWTIDQIIDKFVSEGMGSREKFIEVIERHKLDEYKFVQMLNEAELSPDRKYRLEGYLFPDTYEFYTTETELSIIKKFLSNFDNKFTEDYYNRCEILGMTVDEVITLASMVEREARNGEDFPKIAAVFHNRLVNRAAFPLLESDATIIYTFAEHRQVTPSDLEQDVPYNTYKRIGLPPSAICNPGYDAIVDTLFPAEIINEKPASQFYYFVANTVTGEVLYGETHAQHLANINTARAAEAEAIAAAGQ